MYLHSGYGDQSDIYEVFNVAGSSFGSYLLVMFWTCNPSVCTASYAAACAGGKLRWHQQNRNLQDGRLEGQNVPIRKGRTNIYVNRISLLLITVPAAYFTRLLMLLVANHCYLLSELQHWSDCPVVPKAPDKGTEIAIETEINIEALLS